MNTKTIDISKSSLLSLKAEVLRKQEEVNKAKLSAKTQFIHALSRSKAKTGIFDKKNSGVDNRDVKDVDPEEEDLLRKSRRVLEAKSKLYDRLSRQSNVLSEDDDNGQKNQYLVQFSKKALEKNEYSDDDGCDYDEYDKNIDPEDDWVEYVDCLGRTRKCLRRDLSFIKEKDRLLDESLPLNRKIQKDHNSKHEQEKQTHTSLEEIENPDTEFDEKNELLSNDMKRELMRQEWEKQEEVLKNKSDIHYQDILFNEARNHGVGYFSFSQDEEERIRQQQELKKLRDETKQKQNIIQEKRSMRQKQLAAREKAAKNRKRARMGLPPEENEPELIERPNVPEKSQEELEKEIEKENLEKEKESARKRIVRPWDIGKDGVRKEIKTQEEWVQEKRSERPKDFAPPSIYSEAEKKKLLLENVIENNSLYFTTKNKKQKHNWRNDFLETVSSSKKVDVQKEPFWIDTSIPPPNFIPGPVLFNNKESINPYKRSSMQNIDDETSEPETNDTASSSGFQNTFKPVPIVNECEDTENENTKYNKGSEKYSIDDLSDTSSSEDDGSIMKKRAEIPPPATFEYYGPSSTKKLKQSQPVEQIKSSVEAGLKFLRQQVEKKKARTENVGFFE